MDFALNAWMTSDGVDPGLLADAAEAHGFSVLFVPEHTHIPERRESPYIGGGEMPSFYGDSYDPFVALMRAAATTSTLLLGTGICLVAQRDPIILARESATLDRLSGGRLVLGVGAGWNREELRNHGVDPAARFEVLAEKVQAVQRIWSSDVAEYHGAHVSFEPIRQGVSPLQQPGPPILAGLDGARGIAATVAYADGWFPSGRGVAARAERRGVQVVDWLRRAIGDLRERAEAAGKPRPSVTLNGAAGDAEVLSAYAAAGVDRVVFTVNPVDERALTRRLQEVASAANLVGGL